MNGHRTCKICFEVKAKSQFATYGYQCRSCRTERQRAYYASMPPKTAEQRKKLNEAQKRYKINNPQKVKDRSRAGHIKRHFGLSINDYEKMLKIQNDVCAICEISCATGYNLAIDHNHLTGEIRGLLCKNCNTGIGLLKEDLVILDKAKEYLAKYEKLEIS